MPQDATPNGLVQLEVPGLCPGRGVDIQANAKGYILFVQEGCKVNMYSLYQKLIVIPFIEAIREAKFGWLEESITNT